MNSMHIAIMMKVNKLAERFGIEPYQFNAQLTWRNHQEHPQLMLSNFSKQLSDSQVKQFVKAVTGKGSFYVMEGCDYGQILKSLCDALHVAPKSRARG